MPAESNVGKSLFVLNSKDYTQHIKVPTYNVNTIYDADEWVDANHTKHYILKKKRVSGSFTLLFDNPNEYFEFLSDLEAVKIPTGIEQYDGVILYLNNELGNKQTHTFTDVRLTFNAINELPFVNLGDKQEGINVSVEADY